MRYFEDIDWVIGAVSRKKDGDMKNPFEKENRRLFLGRLGLDPVDLAIPVLEHGSFVKRARKGNVGSCDGLITNEKKIILSVTVADCLPVFLLDPERKTIGLIHAGWRGLVMGTIGNAVTMLSKEFGSDTRRIMAVIGPGICQNHFEVGQDISSRFKAYPSAIHADGKKRFVDIKKVAQIQLTKAGLQHINIEIDDDCTFCLDREYFSYRRDCPEEIEAMLCIFVLLR